MAVSTETTKEQAQNLEAAIAYLNGGWLKRGEAIPTLEGLCRFMGMGYDAVKSRAYLADVIEQIKLEQASKVLTGGLTNTFNATIAKLILASKHDYIEKTQVEQTGEQVIYYKPDKLEQDFDTN